MTTKLQYRPHNGAVRYRSINKVGHRWIFDQQGTFTIESTLIFPVIFIATIGFLIFSIVLFQQAQLFSIASLSAERTAFTWDNSYKNPYTGAYYIEHTDGLYWRNFDDSVSDIFQFLFPNDSSFVKYEGGNLETNASLPQKKLMNAIRYIPKPLKAEMTYTNHLFDRKVTVRLESSIKLPALFQTLIGDGALSTSISSTVVEPVEFIRNVNLMRTYIPLIKDRVTKSEFSKWIGQFRNKWNKKSSTDADTYTLSFRSHNEARDYLQKLVHGNESKRETEQTGKWRLIDALDSNGVAHQAYYGMKTKNKDMTEQMRKDAELLQKGEVNGVIWHFFRKTSDGSIGPTASLVAELEKNGIVVVIHDK